MSGLIGNLLGDITGGATSLFDFMSHPLESIMFFIGGVMLLIIVYRILAD